MEQKKELKRESLREPIAQPDGASESKTRKSAPQQQVVRENLKENGARET